jgi:hypothetical protein
MQRKSTIQARGTSWAAALALASAASATVLSDNITAAQGGTEVATSTHWLCAGFTTDATSHSLTSITLLMASNIDGAPQVAIYTDAGLQPGTLVGTLTNPGTFSSTPTAATFIASGITLSASTSYWVVLKPTSGTYAWSWTASNSGTGITSSTFTHVWGSTDDGSAWWTDDFFPLQMTVVVDACSAPSFSTQPTAFNGCLGQNASFTIAASGASTYQWRKNGVAMSNAGRNSGVDTPSLSIANVHADDRANYDCLVTASCGSTTPSNSVALNLCPADFNCSGAVNVQDIFDFLNGWFASSATADYNDDGVTAVQDIFDFLSGWFAGC